MADDNVNCLRIDKKLKTFSSIFCEKFKNLEVVEIYSDKLELIDENSLQNCKELKFIRILVNKIRNVPGKLLIENSKLAQVKIRSNKLTTIPENFFQNQHQLEQLALVGNEIDRLPSGIFHPLVNLQYLSLEHNELYFLDPEWFLNLRNLRILDLKVNHISEVPSGTFKLLESLQKLYLRENKIEILTSTCFEGLEELKILELNNNEITELPVGVFDPLKKLEVLSLDSNKLTEIHADSFGSLNNFIYINLQNNKITALDKNIIKEATNASIYMSENLCYNDNVPAHYKVVARLTKCFKNYRPRPKSQLETVIVASTFTSQYTSTMHISVCGKPKICKETIIGGSNVVRGSFPWNAALQRTNGKFFCGGTLVSNRKVVTAAHCIQGKQKREPTLARDFFILLGVHDLNAQNEAGREVFPVHNIHMHPEWNPFVESYDADIAVLVLEGEATFGRFIQPICLIELNSSIASITDGIVAGFGKSEDPSKNHENVAKVLDMPIHNNEICFLKNYILGRFSSLRTFCGGTGNGTGVCDGDSGSGLFVKYDDTYYFRGVVSASLYIRSYDVSCDVNSYSIFTDVLKFTDWINGINVNELNEIFDIFDEIFRSA